MLLRFCQLKSLFLLLLLLVSSCSWWKSEKKYEASHEMVSMFQSKWFAVEKEHTLIGPSGKPLAHLFFDVTPEFSMDSRLVNVVITTPQGSNHNYQLDIPSGQRHYAYTYCQQKNDSFSIGHIPRMLDQLGTPQKVIVFSDGKKVEKLVDYNYFRVKLIGAYVEKSCLKGSCEENTPWLSRLVFIGVDIADLHYAHIDSLADLLKQMKWQQIKDTLEDIEGKNNSGFPAVKIGSPLIFKDAFDFFKKHSIFLSDRELNKIKSGCTALYDRLWTEVGGERPEDRAVETMDELNAKVKLLKDLRKKGRPAGFAQRFQTFIGKYYQEMSTCNKFVYEGNINLNREKFWFLKHLNLFFRLHKEGYYFDCRHKSWQRNIIGNRGEPVSDLKQEILHCNEADIDLAMAYIPNFLERIKGEAAEYYRFIDYDNHVFGAHHKMYTWVKLPLKKFECSNDPNEKIRKGMSVFPEEIKWQKREVKDIGTRMKIIY